MSDGGSSSAHKAGRDPWAVVLASVGTILLVLATLVAVVEAVAFDNSFYKKEYQKLNTAAYVGVNQTTLEGATDTLLAYLRGERDSLDMPATIDGQDREYYNDREKAHMADVAVLNQNAVTLMVVCFPVGALLIAVACFVCRRLWLVLKTCFVSIICMLAMFALLAVWAAADFNTFWVTFHHVFFTNDLWLLDPAESLLIRMYEQTFFFDMVAKILAVFLSVVAATLVATGISYKKLEKKCK